MGGWGAHSHLQVHREGWGAGSHLCLYPGSYVAGSHLHLGGWGAGSPAPGKHPLDILLWPLRGTWACLWKQMERTPFLRVLRCMSVSVFGPEGTYHSPEAEFLHPFPAYLAWSAASSKHCLSDCVPCPGHVLTRPFCTILLLLGATGGGLFIPQETVGLRGRWQTSKDSPSLDRWSCTWGSVSTLGENCRQAGITPTWAPH